MFLNLLKVFLWKNSKRILFFWKTYLLGLAIPLILITVIFVAKDNTTSIIRDADGYAFDESSNADLEQQKYAFENLNLYWAPNSSQNHELMLEIYETLGLQSDHIDSHGFASEAELKSKERESSSAFIIFENGQNSTQLRYKIKIQANNFETNKIYSESIIKSRFRGPYLTNSFLSLQHAIETSFIRLKSNNSAQIIPEIEYYHNPMKNLRPVATEITPTDFAYYTIVAFLLPCITGILNPLVEEKQDGVKEILSIATTYSFMNQVGYFILNFGICVALMFVILSEAIVFEIFDCTNPIFPLVLMLCFILSLISFTFFISAFFDSVTFCQIVGFAFYALPIIFFNLIDLSDSARQFSIFSPMSLYIYGMKIFESYAQSQRCFGTSDLFESKYPNSELFSLFAICAYLIQMSVFYLFLYYYISSAFPGQNGTPEPFYFMLTKSYWRRKFNQHLGNATTNGRSSNSKEFVQIRGLTKVFSRGPMCGPQFTAVNDVSFSLPEQHISVLLGHNGAGKTTTMEMITGITPPTSGKIFVDGEDNVAVYRTSIGYCPQHDVFISYLNCRDHLIFFGRLRGLSYKDARMEAKTILDKVRLTASKNKPAKSLSRGMKRRLCLACAVIGDTKLVILDEPSSGLDPESRRDLWDVLLPLRKTRTILLTTHSMEEADVLGDKIIILDNGRVITEGTTFQLKRTYGSGYTLKLLIRNNFKQRETMNTIEKYVPNVSIKSNNPPTLQITLPYTHINNFSDALSELEKNATLLGIDSIGICNTTMEEVFLNSATTKLQEKTEDTVDSGQYVRIEEPEEYRLPEFLYFKQFLAIFYKKFVFTRRHWKRTLVHCLIPVFTIFLTYLAQWWFQKAITEKYDFAEAALSARHVHAPDIILAIDEKIQNGDRIMEIFKKMVSDDGAVPVIQHNADLYDVVADNTMEYDCLIGRSFMRDPNVKFKIEANAAGDVVEFTRSDVAKCAEMLALEQKSKTYYYDHLLGGLQIRETGGELSLKIIYQNNILTSFPLLMNYANNLLLKIFANPNHHITAINAPLDSVDINTMDTNIVYVVVLPMFFHMGFFFYILYYLGLPFAEESTEFKLLQQIPSVLYWFTTYLADCLIHTICSVVFYALILFFDTQDYIQDVVQPYIFAYICLAGYVYIPIIYIMSKTFKKISIIYSILIYMFFAAAIGATFFVNEKMAADYPVLFFFLSLLPDFSMRYYLTVTFALQWNFDSSSLDGFYWIGIFEIIILICVLIFVFENIYLRAALHFRKYCPRPVLPSSKVEDCEIGDVTDAHIDDETDLVDSVVSHKKTKDYILIVSKLFKTYGNTQAVKGINFSVEKGECFGLLGMNGAGKTTTFKMMTLNNAITSGDIYVNGYHNTRQKSLFSQQFGYCPEGDALLDFMSAYETLKYMGWIKGIAYGQLDGEVKTWLQKVDLVDYKNVQVYQYSGGTKRKLNTAVAMIANPNIVYLDEPTSGVDPVSRRFMWHCIKQFQSEKKTVVLTSHSMDECEELCSRLAIMNSGQFKCIGFIQKLKSIYGKGYTLLIKTFENTDAHQIAILKTDIKKYYTCTLRDDYAGTLIYSIEQNEILWSETFRKVLNFIGNYKHVIEDFAINEISLEDIFLQFRDCENNLETSYL